MIKTYVQKKVQKDVQTKVQTKIPAFVLGATLLAGVSLAAAQLVVPGRAGVVTPAKLSATAHPPVPNDLSAMWLVPSQSAKPATAMTSFVRGVRLLEEDARPAAALPLLNDKALSTTPVADYARYYTGLALMKLDRYAEADRVFSDLASRQIAGHLPEDAAFRLPKSGRLSGTTRAPSPYNGLGRDEAR